MRQDELYDLMKKGKKLTANKVKDMFGCTIQHANHQLCKVAKLDDVKVFYVQQRQGDRMFCIKHYKIKL